MEKRLIIQVGLLAEVLILSLLPYSPVWAARKTSANYTVEADVLAGGGDWSIQGNYYNNSTLAQNTSVTFQTSADYANRQGYWGNSQFNPTVVTMKEFMAQGFDGVVAIIWETGAEIDNLGFHLHRAESATGIYIRITDRFILVLGANPTAARYLFIDRRVDNGKTYYYKLEDIDFTGVSELHGPVEATPVSDDTVFNYDPGEYAAVAENESMPIVTPSPLITSSPSPTAETSPTVEPVPTAKPVPTAEPLPTAHCPLPTPSPFPTPHSPFPIPHSGDYNGDGTSDIASFRPSSGLWSIRGVTRCYFGRDEDIPVNGDYNGDGTAEIAVFRGLIGLWAVRGATRCYFGGPGDIPVPADYDGEGRTEFALFRNESGLWALRDVTRCYFGAEDDLPIPGDYDGDGTAEIALFRNSSGLWAIRAMSRFYFGFADDLPVPADYDGDWTNDPAIFRPAVGLWAVRDGIRCYFGAADDLPVPADYDGDGYIDIGVFRKRSGLWAIRGLSRCYFGGSGTKPVVK